MSKALYDAEAASALLVPSGTTITASTTYAGVKCSPPLLATSMWHLDISAINSNGTYAFILECSPSLGGVYSVLTQTAWPVAETSARQFMVGIPASLARQLDATHLYLRVRAVLGGGSPSCTFTSWIGKPAGAVGTGSRGRGDALSVP
jgi:hypothetical protein